MTRDEDELDPTAIRPGPWRALGLPFLAAVLFTGVVLAATGATAETALPVRTAAWGSCPGDAGLALPPGHPPVPGAALPPGHPPVEGRALPPGHPPVRGDGPMRGLAPALEPSFEGPPVVTI
jgi:hypothetical protein